jgi:hypothetical protein
MHELEGPRPVPPRLASDHSVARACSTCHPVREHLALIFGFPPIRALEVSSE